MIEGNHRSGRRSAFNKSSIPHWKLKLLSLLVAALLLAGAAACGSTPPPVTPTFSPLIQTATPTPAPAATIAPPTALPTPTEAPTAVPSPTAIPGPTRPAPTPTAVATRASVAELAAEFSSEKSYAHVKKLAAEIGSRPAGSEGERQAREYISAVLRSYGYAVEEQPFGFEYFKDLGSTVSVVAPVKRSIAASAMSYSGSGQLTAQLVDLGLGRAADYSGRDVVGKVVLAKRGEVTFREKASNAGKAGASGVLIYNNAPGSFYGTALEPTGVPVLAISGEDGEQLLGLLQQGRVEINVVVKAEIEQRSAYNVVGQASGAGPKLLIGAHFDSVPVGPGANDNASGVAVMLEMARLMAKAGSSNDVIFVAFGAEELGLLGSKSYVRTSPPTSLSSIRAMINLDMVGEGSQLAIRHKGGEGVAGKVAAKAGALGIATRLEDIQSDSDHAGFAAAGIPVFHLFTGFDPYYHTAGDTADQVRPTALRRSGHVTLLLMDELI